MQFSPRIRDIGGQQLYGLDRTSTYPHLRPLLKGRIKRSLILSRWDDMVRVAGSLKLGWVTASLLLSKLQAYPRRNALSVALQEYGRLIKTLFILRYLEDETYRRRINTQLNKGEALHALREFLFFANKGTIRHKQEEEQTNQAGCLNLLTNAVVAWNTVYIWPRRLPSSERTVIWCAMKISLISHRRVTSISTRMGNIVLRSMPRVEKLACGRSVHPREPLSDVFFTVALRTPNPVSCHFSYSRRCLVNYQPRAFFPLTFVREGRTC